MLTMHWKKLALVGLLVVAWLVAAGMSPEGSPAVALGFTSTPTHTAQPPTATATLEPTNTPTATLQPTATATATAMNTPAPTLAPEPTQAPQPQPQPTEVPPTPTPVPAPAHSVPKTGSGLLWVAVAAGLGVLLFGTRKARMSAR
jgi:predicted component of type VI protein secretion system